MAMLHQRRFDRAISYLSEALRRMPNGLSKQYNAVNMHYSLGLAFFYGGKPEQAAANLSEALRRDPNMAEAHYNLALVMAKQGNLNESLRHYSKATQLRPGIDTSPMLHYLQGINYAEARQFRQAILSAEKALGLARAKGDEGLAKVIEECLVLYRQAGDSSGQSR
jgi:tetratricopeptide (TPR) repeat protein